VDRRAKVIELFRQRFNCCQAVFTAYRQPELDEPTALKLATVFGAGGCGTGRGTCGAVAGALLAISMKHGRAETEDEAAKRRTYELGRRFRAEFEARNGSCFCRDLIGVDLGLPEGYDRAVKERLFETKCLSYVRSAAELLEDLV
jgi:C_GCAxxG_C_C family probable redox protein